MKRSTQWDIVGVFALVMAFVSFFALIFGRGPVTTSNILLFGLANPLLIVVFLGFSFMCFIFGYLKISEKAKSLDPNMLIVKKFRKEGLK